MDDPVMFSITNFKNTYFCQFKNNSGLKKVIRMFKNVIIWEFWRTLLILSNFCSLAQITEKVSNVNFRVGAHQNPWSKINVNLSNNFFPIYKSSTAFLFPLPKAVLLNAISKHLIAISETNFIDIYGIQLKIYL